MISTFSVVVALVILGLTTMQSIFVVIYVSFLSGRMESKRNRDAEDDYELNADENKPKDFAPKAAIILCLRGADESLIDCLNGLYALNYPDYELHLVFDSEDDPAKNVTDDFFRKSSPQPITHIFEPIETCSLKCAGIIHTIEQLSDSIEIVAFVDADTVVDQNWLSDLVEPLADESIGATTGNRWFSPDDHPTTSYVQKVWNAAAVVQMYMYEIPWGGSMAMRRTVIDECGLLDIWSRTFCEDTILPRAFRKFGYRVHRVNDLILDNNEGSTVSQTFEWMVRQLLTVRLHHSRWMEVMTHGLVTGLATVVAPILAILFIFFGSITAGMAILKAWFVYQVFNLGMLCWIGYENHKRLAAREVEYGTVNRNPTSISKFLSAALLTQVLHPLATLSALFASRVNWRGVDYRLSGSRLRIHKVNSRVDLAQATLGSQPDLAEVNSPTIVSFPDSSQSKAN